MKKKNEDKTQNIQLLMFTHIFIRICTNVVSLFFKEEINCILSDSHIRGNYYCRTYVCFIHIHIRYNLQLSLHIGKHIPILIYSECMLLKID